MKVEHFVARINERHHIDLRLQGRYAGGENHGAYAVVDALGTRFVLKFHRPYALAGLERACAITERLRELGVPTPLYRWIGTFEDGWTYWVQSALAGTPPGSLTDQQLQQLFEFNDLQAGQAISHKQNWSAYVHAVVFEGESGWTASLHQHSIATREVLRRLEQSVAGKQTRLGKNDDIVHGDLVLDNMLVDGERISGIVDWDAAGCGDRVLDLAKPLFSSYDNIPIRRRLQQRIIEIAGQDSLCVHMAYAILAQLDWSIHHHPPAAVDDGVRLARMILDDLQTLRQQ